MATMKYCEYFDIDEAYFPCIDESAINAGVDWKNTYPHETFIKLLKMTEVMLSGTTKRSLWIHGAYGTGKSQCAYALKKILEVPEDELRAYWDRYEPLKKEQALLGKLIGHKEKKILTSFRYASGSIDSPQQFFFAVQESIKAALEANHVEYKGENTLKESVIAWMEKPAQKALINSLLQMPEWKSLFSESSAEEIVEELKTNSNVSSLMGNIFRMSAKEGFTALSLDADKLRNWIKDIITKNGLKIVLIWDEFSDFFRLNRNSLGDFQKIVSICEELPFYLIVVTHPLSSISNSDESWKIVQQRFDRVEIELPENIAFELIGHAFNVKEAAKAQWTQMTQGLESSLPNSINAVMKAANITDRSVIRRILPIHPIAALVLKNIAHAFQSNQRSMFDFIKSSHDTDVQAFQWFIKEYGPMDDAPFLTVDMLWDFFYVKGKEYLTSDIKLILDTFSQQTMLNEKEKKVLKAVLILQAIDQRLGGSLPLLKPTDQNLNYTFEGIAEYEMSAKNIAAALVDKGILICTPIGEGKKVYGAAVLAGDGAKIEATKIDIRKQSTISRLIQEGDLLPTALGLSPALKLRYALNDTGALPIVTISDFTKIMDSLKHKDASWHFYAVLALAKNEDEAQNFRALIKRTVADEQYKNIIVIDALSSPLGNELFEQYIDYSAMSIYYQGNNNQQAKDNARKAKDILNRTWKDRIHEGQFYIYTYANQDGEKATGAGNVQVFLQSYVLSRFPYVQDFAKGLTETQLKLTQAKQVARYGIGEAEVKGLISGCEKNVLGMVWGRKEYWLVPELQSCAISIIKTKLEELIQNTFTERGRISIDEIYNFLQDEFGFSPCNLSAFITGFLLKEYSKDPYRYINAEGYPEAMTPDKMAEMIGNYIGKSPKTTYIELMTAKEKAFYETTEVAWGVPATTCSSPSQVGIMLNVKMRELAFPIWCLEEIDGGLYDVVKKYIALVQCDGKKAQVLANEIGEIAIARPSIANSLKALLTAENCQKGMELFLKYFEDGILPCLAKDIGAENLYLSDIKNIFSVKHSALWVEETGQAEISKLIVEYQLIKQTNSLLNTSCNTKEKMFTAWRDELKFIGFSGEALKEKHLELDRIISYLLKIVNREDLLPDILKSWLHEMIAHRAELAEVLNDRLSVFKELYGAYLEGFSELEIEEIRNSIKNDIFPASITVSNQWVKQAAENYRKNQLKTQLFNLWKVETNTKNPIEWSARYQTPILCMIEASYYEEAKHVFNVLNSAMQSDFDIRSALTFFDSHHEIFDILNDENQRNQKFRDKIIGSYATLLPDVNRVRGALDSLSINVYDWIDSPIVKQKIQSLASAEYFAGGSDKAIQLIDGMSDAELKQRLKELVQKDIDLGIKIISSEGEK